MDEAERLQLESVKKWDDYYLPLVKRNEDTRIDNMIEVLNHGLHQSSVHNTFLASFALVVWEYAEGLALYVAEVNDDKNHLGKRIKERKKLELNVPKQIGRELKAWAQEREYAKSKWQHSNR